MLRRTALLCSAALVVVGVSTVPAEAAVPSKPSRVAGAMTEVLRGSVQPGKAALRRQAGAATQPKLVAQSTWQVVYEGFGGNTQAQTAFQAAVDVWASIVKSNVPIKVHATFTSLDPGVLGQAGPDGFTADESLGDGVSYYPDALADALAGEDTFPEGTSDISAEFNSTEPDIYYGTDGNPAFNQIDFMSVVLHELGHGLGFTSAAVLNEHNPSTQLDDTAFFDGAPDRLIYDKLLTSSTGAPLFKTGDTRDILRSLVNTTASGPTDPTTKVYFQGARTLNQNYGVRPTLYAPNPYLDGSSIAHLDEWTYPTGNADSLMTPYLQNDEVVHAPGPLTKAVLRDLGWQTAADAPGKVKNVVATKHPSSITLAWTPAPDGGATVTNHTISYTDNGSPQAPIVTGTGTTSATVPVLDGHSYVFTVAAANSAGLGTASDPTPPIIGTNDAVAPTLSFATAPPSGVIQSTSASFSLTGADDRTTAGNLVYKCKVDSAAYATCSSAPTLSNLSNATHTIKFVVLDEANNISSPELTATFRVDTLPPVVTTVAPPIFTTDIKIGLRYSATDPSGISRYDVRYRKGQFNSTMGGYAVLLAGSTATSASLNAQQGFTYCFSVRAYDQLNRLSAWSGERCIATTLDDRALAASAAFGRATGSVYYNRTVTQTKTVGQTLTRTSVQARRVALVATTCNGCGTVGVYFNGKLIRTVSLNAASTTYKRVIPVVDFGAVKGGTLVVKTLNTGRSYIDGVAFNRG